MSVKKNVSFYCVFFQTQKSSPSLSSENTFAEYDLSGLEDNSGLDNRGTGTHNQTLFSPPTTELNGRPFTIPSVSEDEEDSAISGKSSEINENR